MSANIISLPPNAEEVRRALLRKGVLLVEGRVTEAMFDMVAGALCQLEAVGSPDIEVRICSVGGSCHFGFSIYDMLRLYKGKKHGVVIEKAHSMASVILQACESRSMAKHAKMLLHAPSEDISHTVLENKERLKKRIAELRVEHDRMVDVYMLRAKVSRQRIVACMKRDDDELRGEKVALYASEALSFGLIDAII